MVSALVAALGFRIEVKSISYTYGYTVTMAGLNAADPRRFLLATGQQAALHVLKSGQLSVVSQAAYLRRDTVGQCFRLLLSNSCG
jgi:hypothetical protein